jgi:hypothetical protein
MQGASTIDRQRSDAQAIANQFTRFGINTAERARNATPEEWAMAAVHAGLDTMRPDTRTRRYVVGIITADEQDAANNGDPFAALIPAGGF